jgi:acetamidase/formamidase
MKTRAALTAVAILWVLVAVRWERSPRAQAVRSTAPERSHRLAATPQTVHVGFFDARIEPVLRIASGDVVDVDTLITSSPNGLQNLGVPANEVQQSLRDITAQVKERGPGGHILTGPVSIEGAAPGDALEVRILSVDLPIAYGYQACSDSWTFLPNNCEEPKRRLIRFDRDRGVASLGAATRIPLRPFFGILGVAPAPARGRLSSLPPDSHGGNMDVKELVAGATVFLPVRVPGALFSAGDGHAAQGDGEAGGTALETSLRGRLQFIVRKDLRLEWPRFETPTHYMTFGADPDLTQATRIAVQGMIDFLIDAKGMSRTEANALTGIAADLRMSEIVDQNMGVYMTVAKSIFGER